MAWTVIVIVLIVLAISAVIVNVVVRRKGYSIPGKTVVGCSKGHLFTTTWIEGGSLKAVRLGASDEVRALPVGNHWAIVHPVKGEDLDDEDRRIAAAALAEPASWTTRRPRRSTATSRRGR
jgi:hypothetical protein